MNLSVQDLEVMHEVWQRDVQGPRAKVDLKLDEFISSIFSIGPFYVFIIDFSDMTVSNLSSSFGRIHGIPSDNVTTIDQILSLIHPDDLTFVSNAESKAIQCYYEGIAKGKILEYKTIYNFRLKIASGAYELFNHQAIVFETDENGKYLRSLNIHTNINHITTTNNYNLSLLGLNENPSYFNINLSKESNASISAERILTKREMEIARLLVKGDSSKLIADKLFLSVETVKTHRRNILRKAGCVNTVQLAALFTSEGLS